MEEQGQVQTYQDIMDACGSLESYFNPVNFNQQAELLEELYGNNPKEKQESLQFSDNFQQNHNRNTTSKPPSLHVFDFNNLNSLTERNDKQMNPVNVGQMYIQNLLVQKESERAKIQQEKGDMLENQEVMCERYQEKQGNQLNKIIQKNIVSNSDMEALSVDDNLSTIDQRRQLGEICNNIENTTNINNIQLRPVNGINSINHLKCHNITPNYHCLFRQTTPPSNVQETNPKASQPQINQSKTQWKVLEGQWRVHRDNRKRKSMSNFAQTMKQNSELMKESSLFSEDSIQKISKNLGSQHNNMSQQVKKLSIQDQPYLPISKGTYIEDQRIAGLKTSKADNSLSKITRPSSSLLNIKRINGENYDQLGTNIRFQLIDHSKINGNNANNFKKNIIKNHNIININDQDSSNNSKLVFSNFRLDLSRNKQNNQNNNSQAVVNNLVLFQTPYFNNQSKDVNTNTTTTITTASRFQALLQQQKYHQNQPQSSDGNSKNLQQLNPPSTSLSRKSRAFEKIVLSYHENQKPCTTKEYFPAYSQSYSDRIEQFKNCSIRQTDNRMNNETPMRDTLQIDMPIRNQGSFKTLSLVNQMKQ